MIFPFSIDTEHGTYTSALNLADDVIYSNEEIETMKQQQLDNWIAAITAPYIDVPIEEVIIEDLIEEVVE